MAPLQGRGPPLHHASDRTLWPARPHTAGWPAAIFLNSQSEDSRTSEGDGGACRVALGAGPGGAVRARSPVLLRRFRHHKAQRCGGAHWHPSCSRLGVLLPSNPCGAVLRHQCLCCFVHGAITGTMLLDGDLLAAGATSWLSCLGDV